MMLTYHLNANVTMHVIMLMLQSIFNLFLEFILDISSKIWFKMVPETDYVRLKNTNGGLYYVKC